MEKSTISMVIFHSYVSHYQRVSSPVASCRRSHVAVAGDVGRAEDRRHLMLAGRHLVA